MEAEQTKKSSEMKLNFQNTVLKELPIDPIPKNFIREVSGAFFSKVSPTPVENPFLVAYSKGALGLLDIDPDQYSEEELAEYFSGNKQIPGSEPAAHCYCGHQFGYFSGQLGDGRAMYLGEVVNKKGERWELQFKGAGQTPYSRSADGRAVLRSSIREFLCSESMYYLGVPTTRAGILVSSDSLVERDLRYDGHPKYERCSIVLRIAPSFIRFGSFEVCLPHAPDTGREGPSVGKEDPLLTTLMDYIIKTHFPHIWNIENQSKKEKYIAWFTEVVERTAEMTALWQTVGFAHGVLNTDNMSILGLTIDYGPFGFLDEYNPDFICNGSDHDGRYSFKNQPKICQWNCKKLAEAIKFAIPLSESEPIFTLKYDKAYQRVFKDKMIKKLGLLILNGTETSLIDKLLETMEETGADMTNTFRSLSKIKLSNKESVNKILDYIVSQCLTVEEMRIKQKPDIPDEMLHKYLAVASRNPMLLHMMGKSPQWLQQQLEKKNNYEKLSDIKNEDLVDGYRKKWQTWLNLYVERLEQSISQTESLEEQDKKRAELMNANNPKFILRNYMAENAIKKAEKGDFTEVKNLLKLLSEPYSEGDAEFLIKKYDFKPPTWSHDICVTCSS